MIDLVEKDAASTVQVRAGDTVRVQLVESFAVPGSSLVWDVTSTDPAVLSGIKAERTPQVRSGPGGTDTYTALFKAAGTGQATLTRTERPPVRPWPSRVARIATSRSAS